MALKILFLLLWMLYIDKSALARDLPELPIGCHTYMKLMTCEGKVITQLPVSIPDFVTHLHVRNASIKILDTEDGSGIGHVTTLIVQNSGVTDINKDFFDKLSGTHNKEILLKRVFINENKITELKEGVFHSASYLQVLSLSNNSLTSIHGVFKGLTGLQSLHLYGNKITEISDTDFYDLENLTLLDLGRNNISNIKSTFFTRNVHLTHLMLDENVLDDEQNISLSNTTLHTVSMRRCQLTQVPRDLPATLGMLHLSENNIEKISGATFDKYANNLKELNLADNNIDSIQQGIFDKLKSLNYLNLSGNRLHKIPGPFPNSILYIYLDNNNIETMGTDHFHWTGPYTFHIGLNDNNITKVMDNLFSNNIKVHSLQLDGNPITVLEDGIFAKAKSLYYLNLSHLKLSEMHENCLLGLEKIGILRMSFVSVPEDKVGLDVFKNVSPMILNLEESPTLAKNLLNSLTENKIIFSGLQNLDIQNNNLSIFTAGLQQSLPDISELAIAGNKFNCTKSLFWLQQWYLSTPRVFVDIHHATCHWPEILHGYYLDIVLQFDFHTIDDSSTYEQMTQETVSGNSTYNNSMNEYVYPDYFATYYESRYYEYETEIPTFNHSPTSTTIRKTTTHPKSEIENVSTTENVAIATKTSTTTKATVFISTTSDTEGNAKAKIPKQHNDESVHMKSVGIAIGMSFGVILVMLIIAFLVYKLCVKQPASASHNGHQVTNLEYVFVTPRADRPEPKVHRKLSRAERGSTTSHASEDITNHIDMNMKVYTLDMDE